MDEISASRDGGRQGHSREREQPEQRLGGRKFRVCSGKNECPDSGFFLSQQLRHFL